MNNKVLKRILLGCSLLLLALGLYFVLRFAFGGSMLIDLKGVDMYNTQILVNGMPEGLYGYSEVTQSMKLADTFGNKKITVHSAGYKNFEAKQSIILRGYKIVIVKLVKADANDEGKKFLSTSRPIIPGKFVRAEYKLDPVTKVRYLTIIISNNNAERELLTQFNAVKGEWENQLNGEVDD
ncbi:hypothetical protein BH10PAT3_BH10PAT3_1790 [soil metagenome]